MTPSGGRSGREGMPFQPHYRSDVVVPKMTALLEGSVNNFSRKMETRQ